jgi:transglutaminase-like putative cysteine protease
MWLCTTCNLVFEVDVPTPFILMLRPRSGVQQWIARETYMLKPSVPVFECTDTYGNLCQRLVAPIGEFSVHTSADVLIEGAIDVAEGAPFIEVQYLPDTVLIYLLPSRYCESDRLGELAQDIAGDILPGYDQVARITTWINQTINYSLYASSLPVSAFEVNERKEGVCRDFAHLGIALCRSLSIPARIVVGYLYKLEPMDLHAWFEAYIGGRWYTFDPTQDKPRGERVAVAYGRDAADVALFNQFGPALSPTVMEVSVKLLQGPPHYHSFRDL